MQKVDIEVFDFELYRGDDTGFTVELFDENNTPIDTSNLNFSMQVRKRNELILSLTNTNGLSWKNNSLTVLMSHDMTKDLNFSEADYDIQMIDEYGLYRTILRGTIVLIKDITR